MLFAIQIIRPELCIQKYIPSNSPYHGYGPRPPHNHVIQRANPNQCKCIELYLFWKSFIKVEEEGQFQQCFKFTSSDIAGGLQYQKINFLCEVEPVNIDHMIHYVVESN